jgi:hypothetical protein
LSLLPGGDVGEGIVVQFERNLRLAQLRAMRLEELEKANVLHRRKLPPPAPAWVYELTDWGYWSSSG